MWRRYQWEAVYTSKNKKKAKKSTITHTKKTTAKKKKDASGNKQDRINEYRRLPLTEENMQLFCEEHHIKCSIAENIVFLTTNCSNWRIYMNGDEVRKVFHENYRISKKKYKKHKKCSEGFHKQNISMSDFYDVVKYIYYHDKDSYVTRKKNRIEMLFDVIAKERQRKTMSLEEINDEVSDFRVGEIDDV